eukprot:6186192-Pleurochrysis_carterae.AAC.4
MRQSIDGCPKLVQKRAATSLCWWSPVAQKPVQDWHFCASSSIRNDFKWRIELLLGVAAGMLGTHLPVNMPANFASGQLTGKINPTLSGLLMCPRINHKSDFSSVMGLTRRALSIGKGVTL